MHVVRKQLDGDWFTTLLGTITNIPPNGAFESMTLIWTRSLEGIQFVYQILL